jgi:predicted DNA-binding protein with PD1-like motif
MAVARRRPGGHPLGLPDDSARVGYLLEGHVWPTLEVAFTDWPGRVSRHRDRETGLALLGP